MTDDLVALRRMLGPNAADWLWDRAHGIGGAGVEGHYDRKSMSRDETFAVDLAKDEDIERTLDGIAEALHIYRKALDEGVEKYLVGRPVKPVFRTFN